MKATTPGTEIFCWAHSRGGRGCLFSGVEGLLRKCRRMRRGVCLFLFQSPLSEYSIGCPKLLLVRFLHQRIVKFAVLRLFSGMPSEILLLAGTARIRCASWVTPVRTLSAGSLGGMLSGVLGFSGP